MNHSTRKLLLLATIFGFLGVAIGAFGAHGLKGLLAHHDLPLERLEAYKTGVSYHFYHTFAIFAAAWLISLQDNKWFRIGGWLFGIGILLFSGSLYLLTLRDILPIPAIVGPITPLGGLFFMGGWLSLLVGIYQLSDD